MGQSLREDPIFHRRPKARRPLEPPRRARSNKSIQRGPQPSSKKGKGGQSRKGSEPLKPLKGSEPAAKGGHTLKGTRVQKGVSAQIHASHPTQASQRPQTPQPPVFSSKKGSELRNPGRGQSPEIFLSSPGITKLAVTPDHKVPTGVIARRQKEVSTIRRGHSLIGSRYTKGGHSLTGSRVPPMGQSQGRSPPSLPGDAKPAGHRNPQEAPSEGVTALSGAGVQQRVSARTLKGSQPNRESGPTNGSEFQEGVRAQKSWKGSILEGVRAQKSSHPYQGSQNSQSPQTTRSRQGP